MSNSVQIYFRFWRCCLFRAVTHSSLSYKKKRKKEKKPFSSACQLVSPPIVVPRFGRRWKTRRQSMTTVFWFLFFSPCLVKEFSLELKSFRSNVRVANDIVFHLSEHAVSIARTGALIWLFPSLSPDIEEEEEEEEEDGNRVGYDNKFWLERRDSCAHTKFIRFWGALVRVTQSFLRFDGGRYAVWMEQEVIVDGSPSSGPSRRSYITLLSSSSSSLLRFLFRS